ncbi:MAG TPA: DUF4388 domain-containing protein [Pyrinomonadaceae bacterium]
MAYLFLMFQDQRILDTISNISTNGESGRLEILAGATQAELSFLDGKLVDARVGHLKGFQAINAIASMRATRFSFDPTFDPLNSSSITSSERLVLQKFFGIQTAVPKAYSEPVAEEAISEDKEEATLVTSNPPEAEVRNPPAYAPAPVYSYQRTLIMAVLAITVLAAVAVLAYLSRERSSSSSAVATKIESASPTVSIPSTPAPAASAPVEQKTEPAQTAQDLSGRWNVVNTVESTSYQSFKNMKIGFALSIDQNGTQFTGKGQKVSENGVSLPPSSRTPIKVQGSINGDRVEATFFEEGATRKSNGRFVWRIDNAGRLNGIFATTAARSSGKSAARREL